ncbi:hypothetical protein [Peribacillus simplex]|uniref:hypothetical protein n=1 Tax=Peribacillus simplex TaxID=1478 RepID=UPI0024C12329|nr:hypothetical protein [Peribacillus simplex]WHY57444.1 hypothetical protein QNH43_03875 [Peribacillus simplex]
MWGKYLWKLRLLLTIPYLLFAIFIFSSIGNDRDYPNYYWLILAIYVLICSIILHKMEKKK